MNVRQVCKGFTLIEMLVVITLIGIIAGVAGYAVSGLGSRQFRAESQQLALLLNHLADRALMKQELIRWSYDSGNKQCQAEARKPDGNWQPLESTISPTCQLKQVNAVTLDYTEAKPVFSDKEDSTKSRDLLFFLPSGEYTPFLLTLEASDADRITLVGDGFNNIDVEPPAP